MRDWRRKALSYFHDQYRQTSAGCAGRGGVSGVRRGCVVLSGQCDWHALAAQGVEFAFIKATEGIDHNDTQFAMNWENARESAVYVGAYHFFRFENDGAEQAENFIRTVPVTENTLPPVIDVELYESLDGEPDVAQTQQELREMLELLEAHYEKSRFSTPRRTLIAPISAILRTTIRSGSAIIITSRISTGHSGSTPIRDC